MLDDSREPKLAEYLTIGKAAKFLGVSANTLRNWDRAGKVKAVRHPVNRYRLYRSEDLRALLKKTKDQEGD
jgi:excisionase family DNA binding protein